MSNTVPAAIAVLLSGPSGVGKSTVCGNLFARMGDIGFSVSYTTRPPRPGEKPGIDYNFIDQEEFKSRCAAGEYLEWAEVHGYYYGTAKSEVFPRLSQGTNVILDIDVQGTRQILENVAESRWAKNFLTVFMAPPTLAALGARLRGRGTEDAAACRRRLAAGLQELRHWREYDYLLVNHQAEATAAALAAIITAAKYRSVMQDKESWL